MSGQRVRCADSSAVWLTTRSQRREAHLKAEVVTKVLNVFSSQTFTQRENQKLFSFTLADAMETTSVEADDDHEKRSHVLQVGAFLLPRTNDLWDFTHDLKNWNVCFCCFLLSHMQDFTFQISCQRGVFTLSLPIFSLCQWADVTTSLSNGKL